MDGGVQPNWFAAQHDTTQFKRLAQLAFIAGSTFDTGCTTIAKDADVTRCLS